MGTKAPSTMPGGAPPPAEGVAEGHPAPAGPAPPYPQGPSYAYQPPPPPPPPPTVIFVPFSGFSGVRTAPPRTPPLPGQFIVGWEISDPDDVGCCGCETLSVGGWVTVVALLFFCLPFLAWIPCVMAECHDKVQRPVYGYPGVQPWQQQQGGAQGASAPYPPPVYAEAV